MPRRLNSASPLSVVALAALGTFVLAGSHAQASNLFRGVSIHNGTPVIQLPPPPPVHLVKPPTFHPLPPPHWTGGWK